MEIVKIVRHSEERKKWRNASIRKKFLEEKKYICSVCGEVGNRFVSVVEHTYPSILGGVEVSCMCKNCHSIKTPKDINFINFMKKMNFIVTLSYQTYFYIDPQEIRKIYFEIGRLLDSSDKLD